MGIEPRSEAWKASVLPLYDARSNMKFSTAMKRVYGASVPRVVEYFRAVPVGSDAGALRNNFQFCV